MQTNIYLKEEKYYNDLYDQGTVERCRRMEKGSRKDDLPPLRLKNNQKVSKKTIKSFNKGLTEMVLYFIKGEEYLTKEKTVKEWMKKDMDKDEMLANAVLPNNTFCPMCDMPMKVISKELYHGFNGKNDKVLFFLKCSDCNKMKRIFEGGEEYVPAPSVCPKCQSNLKTTHKRKENKVSFADNCLQCSYKEIHTIDLNKKEATPRKDPKYLADRERFCLSKEKGQEYLEGKARIERVSELLNEQKERIENKEFYNKLSEIKRLNIAQLLKLLSASMAKHGYSGLELSKPEIGKNIVIEFRIQDTNSDREEYDSKTELRNLIKKTLLKTNWRLMSNGISYRLGVLVGRLRGYEDEKDLIELLKDWHKKEK
jgi:Zn ribbon nucleic-acid-binding protein